MDRNWWGALCALNQSSKQYYNISNNLRLVASIEGGNNASSESNDSSAQAYHGSTPHGSDSDPLASINPPCSNKKHIQCTFIEKELLGFLWFEIILYKQRLIELFGSYVGLRTSTLKRYICTPFREDKEINSCKDHMHSEIRDNASVTLVEEFKQTLFVDYIWYINGCHGTLVLTIPFLHPVYSYPTIFDPYQGQRISLVGFTPLLGVTSHIIPGQVTAVGPDIILVSVLSAKGMSGGAVACAATGAAIGFIGGSAEVAEERFGDGHTS
ncbi:hypothetical protein PROFUN_14830 [Planoprotostelium fungivorum]|uniref:Uncharacterized protein n=1 Tax=Planoprotostelium fungivorum TaxID=1890364 RepID=A0A2P6MNL1_9EUKA|nr:hypothetical protein PROFUN_14830 [Planoprotostelium fungivorum]